MSGPVSGPVSGRVSGSMAAQPSAGHPSSRRFATPGASGDMPPVSVPSGAMAVAAPAEVKLGRMLMESKPPPRALAGFIVGIAGLALWLGLVIAIPLTSGLRQSIMSIVIISAVLFLPSSLLAQWAYARGMLYVAVHENGILRRDADSTIKLGWDQIAGIFERAYEHHGDFGKELRGSFTFVGKAQQIVIDSELGEWIELGRAARERAEDSLFNAYERATDEKRALPFGKLILHPTFIETPDGQFPWNEISFLRYERKGLDAWWLVQRGGGYSSVSKIPTFEVANCRLLVGVLAKNGKLDGIEIAVREELDAMIDATRND